MGPIYQLSIPAGDPRARIFAEPQGLFNRTPIISIAPTAPIVLTVGAWTQVNGVYVLRGIDLTGLFASNLLQQGQGVTVKGVQVSGPGPDPINGVWLATYGAAVAPNTPATITLTGSNGIGFTFSGGFYDVGLRSMGTATLADLKLVSAPPGYVPPSGWPNPPG